MSDGADEELCAGWAAMNFDTPSILPLAGESSSPSVAGIYTGSEYLYLTSHNRSMTRSSGGLRGIHLLDERAELPQINRDCLLITSSQASAGLSLHQIYSVSSHHGRQRHGDWDRQDFIHVSLWIHLRSQTLAMPEKPQRPSFISMRAGY